MDYVNCNTGTRSITRRLHQHVCAEESMQGTQRNIEFLKQHKEGASIWRPLRACRRVWEEDGGGAVARAHVLEHVEVLHKRVTR